MKIKKWTIVLTGTLILILVFLVIAAKKNKQLIGLLMLPTQKYVPTKIPADTSDLFEIDGYIKNDLVYIYVQGGPNFELFDRKLSPFTWMPHSGTYIRVFPYQSQILNHTILASYPTLTEDQAQFEVNISAEMLYRTVKYFKNRNKKAFVLCISHGSQIGLEMLNKYPNISDGLALTMIRLDIDNEAIGVTHDGKIPYFDLNQEVSGRYLLPKFLRFKRMNQRVENMTALMKVSKNRYTELLKNKDLSNVIYVYGKSDNKVGCPKLHEIKFLKDKGVKILELECGHDDLGGTDFINKINELLIK